MLRTGAAPSLVDTQPVPTSVRALRAAFTNFYGDPVARLALILTASIMCYGGGAVLFWFHSIYLGEGGPAISRVAHWLLDSTFAFLFLTPVLAVIMPLAAWLAHTVAGTTAERGIPWLYAAIGGSIFALVATPGPIAHDKFVGRGTYIAHHATLLLGDPSAKLGPVVHYPMLASMAQQLGAGLPLYIALMGLTVLLLRAIVRPKAARRVRTAAVDG